MKRINNRTKQLIYLEGFGTISIEESFDGIWEIDLFPRGYDNNEEALKIETVMNGYGDKHIMSIKSVQNKLNNKII